MRHSIRAIRGFWSRREAVSRRRRGGMVWTFVCALGVVGAISWLAPPGSAQAPDAPPAADEQHAEAPPESVPARPTSAIVRVEVQPAAMRLVDARDTRTVLVTGFAADGSARDVTRDVTFTSLDPAIATVDAGGRVSPAAVGTTAILVELPASTAAAAPPAGIEPLRAHVAVEVAGAADRPVSFTNDVIPILSYVGCNSGACHGAAAGKNGFKLSLRGYDPAGDILALTHDQASRRLDMLHPEESLFLLKPLGAVPHGGGQRFREDSLEYQLLLDWVRAGVPSDVGAAPEVVSLEVYPEYRVLPEPGLTQQLQVIAHYSDGSTRDVTHWARYSSSNEQAAAVDEAGFVATSDRGEAAITVNYSGQVAVARLMVLRPDPDFVWPDPPTNNYIDELVFAKLRDMRIVPSELCTDEEFIRRVYLDVLGIPPTPEEIRAFLADADPTKRARLIDELLVRPEYARVWALKWSDLLGIRTEDPGVIATALTPREVWRYYRWIQDAFATNMPYDEFARQLIAGSGSNHDNPPAMYYRRYRELEEYTENTAQLFFGIRLRCARCHDHPFERWNQNDYYGFAAFFSQVSTKPGDNFRDLIVFADETEPRARHPRTEEWLSPTFLAGETVQIPPYEDARMRLADWITSPENPYFARSFVNRVWSYYFGRGIIDPVDDLRVSNPPSNEALLDALERDFIESGFDVRRLVRTILNSRTYQLAARTNETNADDRSNFSHFYPRRLTAEQLVDSITLATGVAEGFDTNIGDPDKERVFFPQGQMVMAGMIPDAKVRSFMLEVFGRPRRDDPCECERRNEASLSQALHLINGTSVHRRLTDPSGWLLQAVETVPDDRQLVEELYLRVLCRLPSQQEYAIGTGYLAEAPDRPSGAQDLMWALFNSREFMFQH